MAQSGQIIPNSYVDIKKVKAIQFGLINQDDLVDMGIKISKTQVMDQFGRPNEGGINDLRLGTVDKSLKCLTCNCDPKDCPGHFGYIDLARPVYHVGFMDDIKKILKCVCFYCHKILLNDKKKLNDIKKIKNPKRRQLALYNLCKGLKECKRVQQQNEDDSQTHLSDSFEGGDLIDGCGSIQPVFKKDDKNPLNIKMEFKNENGLDNIRDLTPDECLAHFQKISDEDCRILGFDPKWARPDWMIIKKLAVCPPPVRPSVSVDATLRSEDDLTYQYIQILKVSQELEKNERNGASKHLMEDSHKLLQFFVATLMNNELPAGFAQQRSGRPIKAISTRLKGKEGRLRGNLMGKRVDFSARSVISPDPNLLLDELGVPLSIAKNLTFPETVTERNKDRLRALVNNGPDKWPGAKYILRTDGIRKDLRYVPNPADEDLQEGYIVERHMQNGDFVIFNRQPSLHKMSMMGHRAHILPYSTFRLNLSVTTPYNADFDGDEMNMHMPQSYETLSEIINIMHVPKQIVSPQSNRPVMGIVQDTLIGIKLFTARDNFITLDQVMNLVMWISDIDINLPEPAILKPVPLWTGKQIFSLILPNNPKINLIRFTAESNKEYEKKLNLIDSFVLIENSELIQGIICKRTVGSSSGGLIHCIWNECGPDSTLKFLSNCQRLINNWLLLSGWTVGISDIISDEKTNKIVQSKIKEQTIEIKKLLQNAQSGKLECQPGKGLLETFEVKANQILNRARDTAGNEVQKSLKTSNHLKNMFLAGSKGNLTNISQIIACVGQQNVEGKRIPFNFNKRTLPHFVKDDFGPESRGFVENSYLSGLTPQEFFFHAMAGREGIIDTAVKTSETGYIQRRIIKALEDVMIKYDGTVRNSLGNLVEFLYGEDGMAGEFIEDQKIETLNMDDEKLKKTFKFLDDDVSQDALVVKLKKFMKPDVVEGLIYNDDFNNIRVALEDEYKQIVKDRDEMRNNIFKNGEENVHFPINIPRIIWNSKKNSGITMKTLSDLNPIVVLRKINELKKELIVVKVDDEAQKNAIKLFNIILNYNLSCKRLIQKERITNLAFDFIYEEIKRRFKQALVRPGEMVGNIAAQSIGEPATQMTLNTFHFAGVSALNVTLGVPRLKEVINVAKKLKTPSMTIFLKPHLANDKNIVKKIHSKLEYTTMMNVTSVSEIYYDPDIFNTIIVKDQPLINMQMDIYREEYERLRENISPWVLRLELDKKVIIDKDLKMEEIEEIINNNYNDLDIIRSEDNNDEFVIRIRIKYNEKNERMLPKEEAHSDKILKNLENALLKDICLKGIDDIKKVYVKEDKKKIYDEATGGKTKDFTEWIIETDGTNMSEVFLEDEIDFTRVTSNDINQIYETLGIEAVCKALIREVRNVLKPYDIYVNYRHIAILCEVMTQRGFLQSITRHGLNKSEVGPIRKSSFEETVEILLKAGLFGEKDELRGITENILVGQLAPLGTGCFDLMFDLDAIEKSNILSNANDNDIDIDEEIISTPIAKDDYQNLTPYPKTPDYYMKTETKLKSIYERNASFTPATYHVQSPYIGSGSNLYKGDSSNFLTTPNPASQRILSPNVYNPQSDYIRTPGPYSPNPIEEKGSEYVGSLYSPLQSRSPGYQASLYTSNYRRYHETTSPGQSQYSPTTPIDRPSSASPMISSGRYGNSPAVQDPQSGYNPRSPQYNPLSPQYGMSSVYSRGTPVYNPSGNNNNLNNIQSPIQSDEEGEDENNNEKDNNNNNL